VSLDAFVVASSGQPSLLSFWALASFLLIGAVWVVLAVTMSFRGGDVEKQPNRIAQLYGYTVCLVAILTSLISTISILNAAFDRANPLQSEYSFGPTLTSFEAYRATYPRELSPLIAGSPPAPDTVSEATLRQRYAALAADKRTTTRYRTTKTMTTSSILLVIAITLFAMHWRWVRRLNGTVTAA